MASLVGRRDVAFAFLIQCNWCRDGVSLERPRWSLPHTLMMISCLAADVGVNLVELMDVMGESYIVSLGFCTYADVKLVVKLAMSNRC